ncbi:MAG: site-specific integrase [Telluria sp.]
MTLGHHTLGELDSDRICEYVTDRLKTPVSGVTVSIELTYLKVVLKVAGELWGIKGDIEAVTTARKSMAYKGVSTKSVERKRRPTQSEIDKLVAYYTGRATQVVPLHDIIPFAVATAMRVGEICRITWGDLNIQDRTVIIRDRKHPRKKLGNDHTIPLLGDAMAIVLRQPLPAGGIAGAKARIFPYSEKTISSIFPRACQALGIADLHFHDFRHEGVSRLFEQKYSIEQVSLISGHEDWAMLKRYLQLEAKDLHRD